jgi:hypothetical protein
LFFRLPVRLAGLESGGEVEMAALAGDAVRAVQEAKLDEVLGPEPGFLYEFEPGQFLWAAGAAMREPALRERPGTPPDRVAEFLDEVEAIAFGRDDQGEIGLLHERVAAARAIPALDLVLAEPHPAVLVDDAGRERADIRAVHLAVVAAHWTTSSAGTAGAGSSDCSGWDARFR